MKLFPRYFHNVVFMSVGVVDSATFQGVDEVDRVHDQAEEDLKKYVDQARRMGLAADYRVGMGTEAVAGCVRLAEEIAATSRLLVKTGRWSNSTVFPNRIPVIAADVPAWLQKNGVKLLGVDLPSMDELDSKSLQNHHALARAGIAIIESLDLSDVPTGIYNFAALPLKIAGADGAPVRAVLWRD